MKKGASWTYDTPSFSYKSISVRDMKTEIIT